MKRLANLVRLHRLQLNERRRTLAGLESERDRLLQQQTDLARELEAEKAAAASAFASGLTFTAYLRLFEVRRERLANSLADVGAGIEAEMERIAEAYADLKKYETVLANRKERERREQDRRQVKQQDEVGLNLYRRGAAK